MRMTLAAALLLATSISAVPQTLLGNCAGGFVGVDIPTGNVYCTPPSSPCGNATLDLTDSCNLIFYIGGPF